MLNRFKHRRPYALKAVTVLIALYMLICLSCGKRMPPLPPVERVPQKVQIEGVQRGNTVLLNWMMPARNASDGSVLNIDRVDVYRYAEPSSTKLSLTEQEFESQSTLISSIKFSKDDFGLKKQTYSDKLEFAGQPIRLIYAVRFVNSSGQKAAFSNFLLVESTSKVANSPSDLTAESTEAAVVVRWIAPIKNVDDSEPVNIVGYNVYRRIGETDLFKILNPSPISGTMFSDDTFEFGKKYEYFVRTVSLGVDGETVESIDSNVVKTNPVDVFPPSPPSAITIASAPNNLSIFFATNPEKDIVGYRLYRSTDPKLPYPNWTLLTAEILKANTYQDKKVEAGKTYYYYLTATDSAGNVSERSEIVSETAR
jgi:fibronectin type 3 domain-containing protein